MWSAISTSQWNNTVSFHSAAKDSRCGHVSGTQGRFLTIKKVLLLFSWKKFTTCFHLIFSMKFWATEISLKSPIDFSRARILLLMSELRQHGPSVLSLCSPILCATSLCIVNHYCSRIILSYWLYFSLYSEP